MTSSSAKSPSTLKRHRRALALIAAGCCAILLLAYITPYAVDSVMLESLQGEGWRALVRRIVNDRHPEQSTWLWSYHRADAKVTDALQIYGKKAVKDENVVFLAIDSASFEQSVLNEEERRDPALQMMTGGFPFPRSIYPLIIQRLVDAGAKAVVFDIMFPGPKEPEVDAPFREALEKYRDRVVIGGNLQRADSLNGSSRSQAIPPSPSLIPGEENLFDDRVGFVNFTPDRIDGIVRQASYRTNLQEYFGQGEADDVRELLSLGAQGANKAGYGARIPATHEPHFFRYLPDQADRSLHEIFVPYLWQQNFRNGEFFRNKIVLIGPYGNWSKDELPTPFGTMLGPMIHLSALNALITHDFLHPSSYELDVFLIVLGSVVALAAGVLVSDPVGRIGVLVGLAALFVTVAFVLFNLNGLLVNLLGPSASLLTSGLIGLAWEQKLERDEKKRVRSTLERYVSKDVVKEVLDNPESYLNTAGGMRKPITLLFSDIRGFTAMTESADAAKLVAQLNEYFSEMVRIVFANRGTLDKFIGDAVMAQWGAFVTRGEGPDACRAVAAALDMLRAMPKLNAGWKARGFPELKIGIGVNHGQAICANIGSDEKQEFTAIGDAVNLASRLEGATKKFHQELLIGEQVAPLVADHYVMRPVDFIQVQGKSKPVEVFAVLGDRKEMKEPAWLATYVEGIRLFRRRAFDEARAKFTEVLEATPGDWLAQEYLRRCDEFQAKPPEESWDGSYEMLSK